MDETPSPAEYLKLVREETERAQQEAEQARKQADLAVRGHRFLKVFEDSLQREHYAHGLLLLRQERELLQQRYPPDEPTALRMRELQEWISERAGDSARQIARDFPPKARDVGIQIDSSSRHPTYTFHQGFLRLEMDERKLTAKVAPRDGREIVMGLDLGLVVDTIRSEQARLFERRLAPARFLRSLRKAYLAILKAEKRPEGDEVPLRRVTNRLSKNLRNFSADEFNVDLSRLVQRGELAVDGNRVHLNHTRDRRQGMLLHGLESGGYVGFISFKKEK